MATGRKRLWVTLSVIAAVGILGGVSWYAYTHGLMDRMRGHSMSGQNGMAGMNMPGMNMGSDSGQGSTSGVPDHATITLAPELQQRIGLEIGPVEKGPLKMSLRTVGIVRPDETKVARVHLKTEGWAEKLFVNFTGQNIKKGDPLLSI